jgi:hypothetical protein
VPARYLRRLGRSQNGMAFGSAEPLALLASLPLPLLRGGSAGDAVAPRSAGLRSDPERCRGPPAVPAPLQLDSGQEGPA